MRRSLIFLALACLASGCQAPDQSQEANPTQSVQSVSPTPTPIAANWRIQAPEVNKMDGAVTQFISTGDLSSGNVEIVLCYKNGRPCGNDSVAIYVSSPCYVESSTLEDFHQYQRRVRIKFDDGKLISAAWGITDNHMAVFPRSPGSFFSELNSHNKLLFEFGCDRSDAQVFEFNISHLKEALDQAGIKTSPKRTG